MSRKASGAVRLAEPPAPSRAELEARIAALAAELDEAREQQQAASDVLRAIAETPGDAEATLRKIAETTNRLFKAASTSFRIAEGDEIALAIGIGHGAEAVSAAVFDPNRPRVKVGAANLPSTVIRENRQIHLPDLDDVPPEFAHWPGPPVLRAAGMRTLAGTPLRREGRAIGAFVVHRDELRPFAPEELVLLQSFADQAVIAIENARLITETQEALDQQTATAEVLGVINASPGDLTPVFEAILDKAHALCGAERGTLFLYDGSRMKAAVAHGYPEDVVAYLRQGIDVTASNPRYSPLFAGNRVHIADLTKVGGQTSSVVSGRGGVRTNLLVPLFRNGELLGMISCNRIEVRPFSNKEIALIENFAAQAVIAIENARLITETREALEQQTATAEVLGVINASPGDLQPVFEAMVEKARRLCNADSGHIALPVGDDYRTAAISAMSPEMEATIRAVSYAPGRGTAVGRCLVECKAVQIADIGADLEHAARHAATKGMIRTILGVPLLRGGEPIGAFGLSRTRVEPFTDRQVALVENFADQAVIAIENTRLLDELRQRTGDLQESLEFQTATSDVLKVIGGSAFDLTPVLETVVNTAVRLCRADQATIYRLQDGEYRGAATAGWEAVPEYERIEREVSIRPGAGTLIGRVALSRSSVHILDCWTDPLYEVKDDARMGGIHTLLGVPLLREGLPIGAIGLGRRRVEPYTEKEIALVTTFADQAVIAIENARLLDEIRRRQAELRVTFDNMGDAVVMFDADRRLTAWNTHFQEMLDLPDAFLEGRHTYDEYVRYLVERGEFGDVDPEIELARLRRAIDQHSSYERTRPDGTEMEVRFSPTPDGGFVVMYSDITERKRAEAEIRAARDAAETALRELKLAQANLIQAEKMASLGQLTAGIAHEIKNPLNFVNNFATLSNELLGELKEVAAPGFAALGGDARAEIDETMAMLSGNLDKIAEHGRRADGIVKSMLAHSRGSSGERQSVDLNVLAEEALNLAYHGARAQDQTFNITLERDFAAGIAPLEVVPQDVTRVLLNLIGNGFHAAHKRLKDLGDAGFRPLLRVVTRELGDAVEVRVRDNGTGIPADIRDKLFQPFFTTKPTGEGTGLGLSISYDIVTQQHGGTIAVESEVGAFTEFTVRLPRSGGVRRTGR